MTKHARISHYLELRRRVLTTLVVVACVFVALMVFANDLFTGLAGPLLRYLPADGHMIATQVTAPFLVPFKLAFVTALALTIPFIFYQFWAFIAPGLYPHERYYVVPLLLISSCLFYLGIAFSYTVVLPMVFRFFIHHAPSGVVVMTDMSAYLSFVLSMFFSFGLAFQIPIITYMIVITGFVPLQAVLRARPLIIISVFTLGMLLTPPDVISQTLLALPMWLLFELGLGVARLKKRYIRCR